MMVKKDKIYTNEILEPGADRVELSLAIISKKYLKLILFSLKTICYIPFPHANFHPHAFMVKMSFIILMVL